MNHWRPRAEPALLASALSLLSLLPGKSSAQSQDERAVRAAYVFNLSKYVEWPPENTELGVCVVGNRETAQFLQKMLDGKTSESRTIRVTMLPSDDELPKCNILYFADSQTKRIRATLDKLENKNIVTVGEADSFAKDGGMVGLVKVDEQMQVQVNVQATERAGVRIGSRLLNLAQIVRPGTSDTPERGDRKVVRSVDPEYPEIAAKMSLHGTVKLKIWIAPDGSVRRLECVGGHPLLAQAAEKAVKNWKYEGTARESTQVVDVKF